MLNIIYQDDSIIAVNKPTRLLTVPGKGPDKQVVVAGQGGQRGVDLVSYAGQ